MRHSKKAIVLIAATLLLFFWNTPLSIAQTTTDCGCDHTITHAGTYRPSTSTSGSSQYFLDVYPGQTICIKAGTYGDLRFYGFQGTEDEPITIKNCGGQVTLSNNTFHGFSFENCRYIKLSGNGDAAFEYGFKITGTGTGASGLSVSGKSSDFTVENIEVASANFAGIMMKTDPNCDPSTWRDSFVMYNVVLQHNYVHDVGGEGFYVGNSFSTPGYPTICSGVPVHVFPHRVLGLDIHDNITRRTGCEGIQYGCAPNADVYDNLVEDAGIAPFGLFQNNGIQIGDGSSGFCHHNIIRRTGGGGIAAIGNSGGVKIFNNLITRAGTTGIFVNDNDSTPLYSSFEIYNNSIIRTGGDGIHLRNQRNTNTVRNNHLVETGYAAYLTYMQGATATVSNNLTAAELVATQFLDTITYAPSVSSPTINAGFNLKTAGVIDDLINTPRPAGASYDIGAFETIPCTGTDRTAPTIKNCPKSFTIYTSNNTTQVTWIPPTAFDNCSVPTLTASATPNSTFGLGSVKVIYTAQDVAKNRAICSFTFTVAKTTSCKSDRIKPTIINCPRDTVVYPTAYPIMVNWKAPTATDNCTVQSLTSNYQPNMLFAAGSFKVTYIARDVSNNTDTCRFNITVARLISQCDNDTTKPFFRNCPRDTMVNTKTNSTVVHWTPPTAYDNCIVPSVRSNYTSGQTFNKGVWTVLYVARDLRNNIDSCRFRVTVLDPCDTERTPPIIRNCPKDTLVQTLNYYATVSWTPPTATDNCSTVNLTSTHQPNSVFGIGTRTVIYTARDQALNTATCQFVVNVVNVCATDTVPPVLFGCPHDTTVYIGGNVSNINISWTPPTATDNCTTNPSLFSNILPSSVFGVGTRTVVCSAIDNRGNMARCQFDVSVVYSSSPTWFLASVKNQTDKRLVKSYMLFPNPSSDGIGFLQMTLTEAMPVAVQIFDSKGNLIRQKTYDGAQGRNEWEIDFSELPAGVYFLTPSVKWLYLKPIQITRL